MATSIKSMEKSLKTCKNQPKASKNMNTMAKSMKTIETMGRNAHERFQLHYSANCMFQLQNAANSKGKCPRLKTEKTTKTAPKRDVFHLFVYCQKLAIAQRRIAITQRRNATAQRQTIYQTQKKQIQVSEIYVFLGPKEIYVFSFDLNKFVSTLCFCSDIFIFSQLTIVVITCVGSS